jgi:hypothetical protein
MDKDLTQNQRQSYEPPRPQERSYDSVAFAVITHAIRMAVSLSPLVILEMVPEPMRARRFIQGAAILGTGINETLWAAKVAKSRDRERHR